MITDEDVKLLHALKADDRSAVTAIFLKYHQSLCRISYRIVNDADDAKDVAQEVFIKLWRNRKSLQLQFSLEAYLRRAVINTSLNRLETKKRFRPMEAVRHIPEAGEQNQHDAIELQFRIDAAISSLPVRTKAVFTLIRFESMSYSEVAASLDISEKAVEKEMMKALKLLRTSLRDYLFLLFLAAANSSLFNIF